MCLNCTARTFSAVQDGNHHCMGRCTLVAHDWGGIVAWHTAAGFPHMVEKLVILGLPHPLCFFENMDWDQMQRCAIIYCGSSMTLGLHWWPSLHLPHMELAIFMQML